MVGLCADGPQEGTQVMGLMDELIENHKPTVKCAVPKVASAMSKKDAADFIQAVEENIIPATVIVKVLGKRGIKVNAPAIQHHRRKDCACPR